MTRVFTPAKIAIGLLIVLTGCTTGPRPGKGPRAANWDASLDGTPEFEHVPEAPVLAPAPATPPPVPPRANSFAETWIPLNRWSRENGVGTVQRLPSGPSPTFALKTTNGTLVLRVDSLVAAWNGQELHFGFRPQLIDDQPFVHALDLAKSIQPLLRGFVLPTRPDRVIVIDPGHGGQNLGTRSILDGAVEKDFTLDWARRLEPLLAAQGWRVLLTRTNDVDLSLGDRVAFAEKHQADLFISLHFNATGSAATGQSGVETYCLTPRGMPSTLTRGYEDDVTQLFPNNAFDAENWRLAFRLQRAMMEGAGAGDHGVRRARFMGVLRGQNRPSVLVEGGYLSNPDEARQIADPAYRQTLAEALAAALGDKPESPAPVREPDLGGQPPGNPLPATPSQTPAVSTNFHSNGG